MSKHRVALQESHRFIQECMVAIATPPEHAKLLADLLVEADYRGHYSHGMNRLEMYLNLAKHGVTDVTALPEILKENAVTAWVDGHNGLGVVVGKFCMKLAIAKAKKFGLGMVVAKGSSHYGIAGMYVLDAVKSGLLGFSFTDTSPVVAPTRSTKAAIGTNPISMGVSDFYLDMATSAVAMGKIEMKNRTNSAIPEQWMHQTGALLPLGGTEENSGYKGYGLGMMVEILCGILGGGSFGLNMRHIADYSAKANISHCFLAIDPANFAPGFESRLQNFTESMRNLDPAEPDKPVLVPGDLEKQHMQEVDRLGGVEYVQDQIDACLRIAKELNVKPLDLIQ